MTQEIFSLNMIMSCLNNLKEEVQTITMVCKAFVFAQSICLTQMKFDGFDVSLYIKEENLTD